MHDLHRVRGDLATMRRRAAQVEETFRSVYERWDAPGVVRASFDVARCDQGRGGHHPVLAKVWDTDRGLLFSSRIAWRPADALRLTPWMREQLLTTAPVETLEDDELLADWLTHLDAWADGIEPSGGRWVRDPGDATVRDVLSLPAAPGSAWLPALWVRCDEHPVDATQLDRRAVIADVRRHGFRRPPTPLGPRPRIRPPAR